jgi:hypothetical protein
MAAGRTGKATAPGRGPTAAPATTCILVAGMHRCGTSALTRVLNLHGASLGGTLLDGAADNETGFWESQAVVSLHERLLAGLDRSWSDPRPLPEHWRRTPAARQAEDAIAAVLDSEFAGEPLIAIKDPRLGAVLKLWINVLKRKGIRPVVCVPFRHPAEVAASLAERDHLPTELSYLLWRESAIATARNSRGQPRVAVGYDALLADWPATLRRIGDALGIDWPRKGKDVAASVDAFLSSVHRHHVAIEEAGELAPLLRALQALERDDEDHDAAWDLLAQGGPEAAARLHFEYADMLSHRQSRFERALKERPATRGYRPAPGAAYPGDDVLRSYLVSTPALDDRVVAYFRGSGEAFAEDRAVRAEWTPGATSLEVRADLPAGADHLRIDPSEGYGWFVVRDLHIDGHPFSGQMVARNGDVHVAGDGLHLLARDNDPWVEFELPPGPAGLADTRAVAFTVDRKGLITRIEALGETLGATVVEQVQGAAASVAANATSATHEVGHLVRSDLAMMHRHSVAMEARSADLQAICEAQRTQLDAAREEGREQLQSLRADHGEAQARTEVALSTLEARPASLEGLVAGGLDDVRQRLEAQVARLVSQAEQAAAQAAQGFHSLSETLASQAAAGEARSAAQMAQAMEGIARIDARLAQVVDGLGRVDARLATGSEQVEALSHAIARQREELEAVATQAQRHGMQLEAMAVVLEEVNRSRIGWRLRRMFGLSAPPRSLS